MKVEVKRIGAHALLPPEYKTTGASGFDLRAVVVYDEVKNENISGCGRTADGDYVLLGNGDRIALPCGFAFAVPDGYEMQVRPRSGLSANGIHVTVGTVDSDYRGEVKMLVTNLSGAPFVVNNGDRIAQGVIAPVVRAELEEVDELTPTERGANGFGSTGQK